MGDHIEHACPKCGSLLCAEKCAEKPAMMPYEAPLRDKDPGVMSEADKKSIAEWGEAAKAVFGRAVEKASGADIRANVVGTSPWRANVKPDEDGAYPPGLYRIAWKGGGESLAAIGVRSDGKNWIAPTNWVEPTAIMTPSATPILSVASISPAAEDRFARLYEELRKKSDETIAELERRAVKAIGEASDINKKSAELKRRNEELGKVEGRYIEAVDQINHLKSQNDAREKACAEAKREVENCTKLMAEAREKAASLTKELLDARDEKEAMKKERDAATRLLVEEQNGREAAQAESGRNFTSWKFARDALSTIATCLGVDQQWVRDPADNHSVPVNAVKALAGKAAKFEDVSRKREKLAAAAKEIIELVCGIQKGEIRNWEGEGARRRFEFAIDALLKDLPESRGGGVDLRGVVKENGELRAEVEKWKKDCEAAREHNRTLIDQRRALEEGHEMALEAERLKRARKSLSNRAQVIFEAMSKCLAPMGGAADDIAARVGGMLRAAEMEAEKDVVMDDDAKMEAPKNLTPQIKLCGSYIVSKDGKCARYYGHKYPCMTEAELKEHNSITATEVKS